MNFDVPDHLYAAFGSLNSEWTYVEDLPCEEDLYGELADRGLAERRCRVEHIVQPIIGAAEVWWLEYRLPTTTLNP